MRRFLLLLCGLCLSILVVQAPALAASGYSTDFENFPSTTPAPALTVPGITFNGIWEVLAFPDFPPYMHDQILVSFGPLTMDFATPQSSIQFGYVTCGLPFTLTASRNGAVVGSGTGMTSTCGNGDPSRLFNFTDGAGFDSAMITIAGVDNMGIDNLVTIPASTCNMPSFTNAVMGKFISAGPLYWAPGKLTEPNAIIGVGQSAWVYGLDSTGDYYQIAWSCQVLWVPKETMGPDYDAVWQGRPLPTTTVGN